MTGGVLEQLLDEVRALRAELAELKKPSATEMSPEDYAKRVGLSTSTVRAMIKDGRLPAKRVGRLLRIASDAKIGEPVRAARREDEPITSITDRAKVALGLVPGGRR